MMVFCIVVGRLVEEILYELGTVTYRQCDAGAYFGARYIRTVVVNCIFPSRIIGGEKTFKFPSLNPLLSNAVGWARDISRGGGLGALLERFSSERKNDDSDGPH